MTQPIIDPSSLTEEQREAIRKEYAKAQKTHDLYTSATCINEMESRAIDHAEGRMCELKTLFGKDFFEKGGEYGM